MKILLPIIIYATNIYPGYTIENKVCLNINEPHSKSFEDTLKILDITKPNCWMNWGHKDEYMEYDNFIPMFWSPNYIKKVNSEYKNKLFLIGNEPEREDQNNLTGKEFAEIMLSKDLPNRFACCGNAIWNGRYSDIGKWQNNYLAHNGPIPDYWSITLHGVDTIDRWESYLEYYFNWWEINGHSKPIIIHETSCMYFYECNKELINHIFNNNDLRIKLIFWFSATQDTYVNSWNSYLLNNKFEYTELGGIYEHSKNSSRTSRQ